MSFIDHHYSLSLYYVGVAQPFQLHSNFHILHAIHGNHRTPAQRDIYTVHKFRMFHVQETAAMTNISRTKLAQ